MGGSRVIGAVAICKTPLADGLILILIAQTGNDFTVKPVRHRYVYHEIVRAIVLVPSLRFLSEGQIGGGERHDKRDGGSHLCPSRAASLLLRPPLFTFALVHVRFLTERTIHLGNKVLCLSAPWRRANASSFSSLMDSSFGVSRIWWPPKKRITSESPLKILITPAMAISTMRPAHNAKVLLSARRSPLSGHSFAVIV
jgi:hypothetical protein